MQACAVGLPPAPAHVERAGRVNCVIGAGRVASVQCLFVFACELLSAASACSPDDLNLLHSTSRVGQSEARTCELRIMLLLSSYLAKWAGERIKHNGCGV